MVTEVAPVSAKIIKCIIKIRALQKFIILLLIQATDYFMKIFYSDAIPFKLFQSLFLYPFKDLFQQVNSFLYLFNYNGNSTLYRIFLYMTYYRIPSVWKVLSTLLAKPPSFTSGSVSTRTKVWLVLGTHPWGLSCPSHRVRTSRKHLSGPPTIHSNFWSMASSTCLGKWRQDPISLHLLAAVTSRNRRACRSQTISFFSPVLAPSWLENDVHVGYKPYNFIYISPSKCLFTM